MDTQMCIVFRTRTEGMAIEKKLKAGEIAYEVIPTPRAFSVGCSISIQISESDLEAVQTILAYSPNVKSAGIHRMQQKRGFLGFVKK